MRTRRRQKGRAGAVSKASRWRAVLFDLDGVLIDTMPLHAAAWHEALGIAGVRVPNRTIYEFEGEPGHSTVHRLLALGGFSGGEAELRKVGREVLLHKEAVFRSKAAGVRVNGSWRSLLAGLRRRGVRLGLVTGTSRIEVARVVPTQVLRLFHVVVTGDQVRCGKPHPEPYKTACKRLNLTAGCCIVIENAPYGIRSARAAGAGRIIALASSLPAPYLVGAHEVWKNTAALRARLKQIFREASSLRE